MKTPTFYALVVVDENGQEKFAGAFRDATAAEERGRHSGKRFHVRAAYLE